MADSVSVTSHHSYGSRVGNSFKAILWWIILVWISIWLLAWNEKNYVEQKAALNEWASVVQEAATDQIDSSLEWKEVHIYWETASTAEALKDSEFNVITDDLKLKRTVEMYQWEEDERTECTDNVWWSEDCTTTYTYRKVWSETAISSSSFHDSSSHSNPSNRRYQSQEQSKSPITLWAYTLSRVFVDKLTNYQNINLNEQEITTPEEYQNNPNNFHIQSSYIYIWTDSNNPTIWDLRISFSSVKAWPVSIVGKQLWNELTSYTTSNDRSIALLEQWNVSASDMFVHAQKENRMMTRLIRLVWLVLMFCGFSAMLKFVETIAKVIPFVSRIIWVWTGLISLWLTLVVWFVTIGLAWITVRPVVGISCLVFAVAGIFLLRKWKKDKKEQPIQPAEKTEPENLEKPENTDTL